MTTMFNNEIVKKITTCALAVCLFANAGLAGMIANYNGVESNLPHLSATKNDAPAKAIPHGQISNIPRENQLNAAPKVNVVNNNVNSEVKYNRPVQPQVAQKTKNSQPAIPIPSDQYQILARIIKAEAGGEPFEGQVAVAAVLLNRIRSGKFPTSISANVFRNGEFESVSNGYIWDINPTPSSYKAATLALKGWDPTAGSLYFYNPAKSTSRWIWSRPIYTIIGKHYFAG